MEKSGQIKKIPFFISQNKETYMGLEQREDQ